MILMTLTHAGPVDANQAIDNAVKFLHDIDVDVGKEDVQASNEGGGIWFISFYKAPKSFLVQIDATNGKVLNHLKWG